MITALEYNQRERFETNFLIDFERFTQSLSLPEETIILAKTMWGDEKLIKITCEFAQIHFDIRECNEKGELVRFGYRRNSLTKKEIAERIYNGDWKIIELGD